MIPCLFMRCLLLVMHCAHPCFPFPSFCEGGDLVTSQMQRSVLFMGQPSMPITPNDVRLIIQGTQTTHRDTKSYAMMDDVCHLSVPWKRPLAKPKGHEANSTKQL